SRPESRNAPGVPSGTTYGPSGQSSPTAKKGPTVWDGVGGRPAAGPLTGRRRGRVGWRRGPRRPRRSGSPGPTRAGWRRGRSGRPGGRGPPGRGRGGGWGGGRGGGGRGGTFGGPGA